MRRLGARVAALAVLAGLLLGCARGVPTQQRQPGMKVAPLETGFTFSERQAGYLDVSWQQAFIAAMNLQPGLLRLGAYWDTIEPAPGQYDFTTLDWLLDNTPQQSSVLLTVGMKAPRWPEYFLPAWLEDQVQVPDSGDIASDANVRQATLHEIAQVVQHEKNRPNIKYWQVENEPLDASGEHQWTIDAGFLGEEVALVRSIDPTRPIVVSEFVDTSPLGLLPPQRTAQQERIRRLLHLADIVGLDVYPVRPVANAHIQLSLTWPSWLWSSRVADLQAMARQAGKPMWISEAQAEPWVPARLVDDGSVARNASPALTTSTVDSLQSAGFNTILLWGVEYWYMRSQRYDDGAWWSHMGSFFSPSKPDNGHSTAA